MLKFRAKCVLYAAVAFQRLCYEFCYAEDLIEPKFTSELRNCDVLLGADAKFSVKISGKPLPAVKWFVLSSNLDTLLI